MRMMTGAILILASVILFAVYKISDLKPMVEWYAIGMGVIAEVPSYVFTGVDNNLRFSKVLCAFPGFCFSGHF